MSWTLLGALVLGLGFAFLLALSRRMELRRMHGRVRERERAIESGAAKAQLQHPVIDLSRCLGCGTCVLACPEDGVLELVHGQAMVVRGARCQGISACARECPVGAITVTLADLAQRRDVPVLDEHLEAVGSPGLFLAGEVTAHALIKTAIDQGTAVAAEVAHRVRQSSGEALPAALPRGAHASSGLRTPVDVVLASGEPDFHVPMPAGWPASEDEAGTELPLGRTDATRFEADADDASPADEGLVELCIVGAGPAGLACSLEAKRQGLSFVTVDQEERPGGTVAKYPRRKLVVTQPIQMPLFGKLKKTSYTKEELVELWQRLVDEAGIAIRGGEVFESAERDERGIYSVRTNRGVIRARHVCLALGRRGTPRRLGVPGEELPKVAYSLLDARSYRGRRILVVGGGDSAVEAAMGLAEQPGNEVTLSYRKESFFRIRARNQERLERTLSEGQLRLLTRSEVLAIHPDHVVVSVRAAAGEETVQLPNDEVFVMAGGTAPIPLLEETGISFDPSLRQAQQVAGEQGTGLVRALGIGFALSLLGLFWSIWHYDYYSLPLSTRPTHPKHVFLRPALGAGLWFGIASTALIALNLLYLVRRTPSFRLRWGSLQGWMTSHVATGILAFLCACLHGAMAPRNTVGGHAFWALVVLLLSGAIGRYFYAYVPRAANGRELELAEVKTRLGRLSEEWDQGQQRFREKVRDEVGALIEAKQWRSSFFGRVLGLFGMQRELRTLLARLAVEGQEADIDMDQVADTLRLARRAYRTSLMAAHYEDLRSVLNSWRWLHRWVAALLVLLIVVHVAHALFYGAFFFDGGTG